MLLDLHEQLSFTAKMLTCEMIEGKHTIAALIKQHSSITKESVKFLVYRCEKLYQARADVQRILALLIKIYHDPKRVKRNVPEQERLFQKLKVVVGAFTNENRIYDTVFIFRGQDIKETIEEELAKLEEQKDELEIEQYTHRSKSPHTHNMDSRSGLATPPTPGSHEIHSPIQQNVIDK